VSMKELSVEERLIGQSHPTGSARGIAAVYLRSAANLRPPGPVALARVRTRLMASVALSNRPRLRWKTVLAVVALSVGVGGVTGAAVWVAMPILKRSRPKLVAAVRAPLESKAWVRRARDIRPRQEGSPTQTTEAIVAAVPAEPSEAALGPKPNLEPWVPVNVGAAKPSPDRASGQPGRSGAARSLDRARASRAVATVEPGGASRTTVVAPEPRLSPVPIAPSPEAALSPPSFAPSLGAALAPPQPAPPRGAGLALVAPLAPSRASAAPVAPPAFATSNPGTWSPTPGHAREARLLGLALQRLRHDHDPRAALAILDDHAARFPHSIFGPEAAITRVDALLALDRRPSALAVLEHLELPATTRGRELFVIRAELRVGAKRYAEAISDFTRTLDDSAGDVLHERALHGRIACYLATGNQAQARTDLRKYLLRFPGGRFVNGVRRTLNTLDHDDQ